MPEAEKQLGEFWESSALTVSEAGKRRLPWLRRAATKLQVAD